MAKPPISPPAAARPAGRRSTAGAPAGAAAAGAAAVVVGVLGVAALCAPATAHADPIYAAAGSGAAPGGGAAAGGGPAPVFAQVHIVTRAPGLALERRVGSLPTDPPPLPRGPYSNGDPQWQPVCTAPCDTLVLLGGEYRVAGEGLTSSSPFALHGPTTELRVDAGSYGLRRAGTYLTVIGGIAALAGGIFLAVSAIHPPGETSTGLGAGGYASIAALAGGGGLSIIGIGLIIGGGTSVQDEARRDLARLAPPPQLHATFAF